MCGIVGIYNLDGAPVDSECLGRMNDRISHRGPDDAGLYVDDFVGLGNRRLSIIDVSPLGHQPMPNEDETLWIAYNGEIYNFPGLRAELLQRGHHFRSATDTETILHGYEELGPKVLDRLNGMFALAIWDRKKHELFCARDPIGIKPFYYYLDGNHFLFASEIKALLAHPAIGRELNPEGICNYFTFGHAVAPVTIFQRIHKLLPGHYILLRDRKLEIQRYWDVPLSSEEEARNGASCAQEVHEQLQAAVKRQMISDVPIGAFLSGGVDSSAIVAFMSQESSQPVKTFSVGFPFGAQYNELADARGIAQHFRTDHHELVVQANELPDTLAKLVYHYDEPFGDAACLPVYMISQYARQHVKVVLTGEGGDELFGGYRRYVAEQLNAYARLLPAFLRDRAIGGLVSKLPRFRRFKKALQAYAVQESDRRYATWLEVFTPQMREHLFTGRFGKCVNSFDAFKVYTEHYRPSLDPVNRLLYMDLKTWLPDVYLEKTDKASMAASLEARVPLLDLDLVKLAFRIPGRRKIRGFRTKLILKEALSSVLPPATLRKRKHGFATPIDPWFRGSLSGFVKEILLGGSLRRRGFFDADYIERLMKRHLEGKEVLDAHLWLLLNFELWCQTYLDHPA